MQNFISSYEKVGFVILDITEANITIIFYGWRCVSDSVEAIDTLAPHFTSVFKSQN